MAIWTPFFNLNNKEGSGIKDTGGTIFSTSTVLSGLKLNGANDHTVEFWFKPQTLSLTASVEHIIRKVNSTGGGNDPWFYALANGGGFTTQATSTNGNSGTGRRWNAGVVSMEAGKWDHWAFTFDISEPAETKWRLYKNGVDLLTGSSIVDRVVSSIYSSDGDFSLMSPATGEDTAGGQLFDVRIWSALRTQQQIIDNRLSLLDNPAGEADLVGNWYRGVNDDHTDASSEENDLVTFSGVSNQQNVDIQFLLDSPLPGDDFDEKIIPDPRPGARLLGGLSGVSQIYSGGTISTANMTSSLETKVITHKDGLIKYPLPGS